MDREELGQRGSWTRREGGKKDVSRGPQPGVRGFKEDSGEIDSSEEVRRVFKRKCKRVADPPCSAALCRAVIISASASMH